MSSPASHTQPLISKRMLIRLAIGLFILAALFFGFQWWQNYSKDPDLPAANDTAGMLAAVQLLENGSQVVIIKPDGEILESPGYSEGKTDQNPVWTPDGNRLFFTSDREENAYHIYRWNIDGGAVMRRSFGSRSQSTPTFPPDDSRTGLITAGGFVLEFNPREASTFQVLPPVGKERGDGESEEGTAGQFEQMYQRLGTSFREAKWLKGGEYVAAVMRREDGGEILIVQNVVKLERPYAVIAGDRIEFDVSSTEPKVFFAVNGFFFHDANQIPEGAMKNGKVELPFTALIGGFDPTSGEPLYPIAPIKDPLLGFHELRISPDGSNLLAIAGSLDANGNFEPQDLVVMPSKMGGAQEARRIIAGKLFEPSWHPDSHKIVFAQRDDSGKRGIFAINKDGSGLEDLTKGKGSFSNPVFSPQTK